MSVAFAAGEARLVKFGFETLGGLGNGIETQVLKVTSLAREGQGTLAWALEQKGARLIVFEVGGVIDLQGVSLVISEPHLTIAGQTAPTPGITVIRGGLVVRTHDVRIQHIRVRPGDNHQPARSGWESDGIAVMGANAHDVHIDHVSVSWAVDENFSASGARTEGPQKTARRVTFSNCIIAEALDYASHRKGKHSKGLLVHDYVQQVAVLRNLFVSNDRRNPYFKAHASGVVVNNLMFNPGNTAVQLGYIQDEWLESSNKPQNPAVAVVGNVLRYGRDTYSDLALVAYNGSVYVRDNRVVNLDEKPMPVLQGHFVELDVPPVWSNAIDVLESRNLEKEILKAVGATPWQRDEHDRRIVNSYTQGNARIINSQSAVGGYPQPPPAQRRLDVPGNLKDLPKWLKGFESP